ncbi:MAG: uroporphyrinogen-III C-methyltransferase, partial [Caulobacter sp.]|nr:uroporphyrinogen-III C-methyltransferase [Vitreoscilla sp.]
VLLVTGHTREESEGQDWEAIGRAAAAGVTLVVYMGIAQIRTITERLLRVLPPELPAAVVQHVGSERERSAPATLGSLVDVVASQGFGSPAILLIGRVTEAAVHAALPAAPRRYFAT